MNFLVFGIRGKRDTRTLMLRSTIFAECWIRPAWVSVMAYLRDRSWLIRRKVVDLVLGCALLLAPNANDVIAQEMPPGSTVVRTPAYELHYMPQYRTDGERAARLLDNAVVVAGAKYGTVYRGVPCRVNLYPMPNSKASTSGALIESAVNALGVTACTVHVLTWSAPDWQTAGQSTMGDPKDIEYWNALLVNEYITIFHSLTSADKPVGFREGSAPNWWLQGIEAYDGYYHSTDASLARVRGFMGDGRVSAQDVICCESLRGDVALQVTDDYQDGLPLVSFLAQRFGEDVHRRLMRSGRATFYEALVEETGATIPSLFAMYSDWVKSWEGKANTLRFCASVSDCESPIDTSVSATANSGSQQIQFRSLSEWTLSVDVPWLSHTLYKDSGVPGFTGFNVAWAANPAQEPRVGKMTITGKTTSREWVIAQSGSGPDRPLNLRASIVANTVTLQWLWPGTAPDRYVLTGGLAQGQTIATLPIPGRAPTFTFDAPSGVYYVRIAGVRGGTELPVSDDVRIVVNLPTPSAPTQLLGLANGSDLSLSWTNTANGGAVTGLILDVSGTLSASLPLAVTDQFSFAGVPPGTYTFRVRATNAGGSSDASNPVTLSFPGVCQVPAMPRDLVAYVGGNVVTVQWNAPATGAAATEYVLTVGGAVSLVLPVSGRTLSSPAPPGAYTFTVAARNSCGTGPSTAAQSVIVP